ncbi:MAG: hypothetical protein PHS41_10110 [Victivallaceae bacterium]|nr:hypothetical protein [Victivallaceae bacterium]
MTVGMNFLLFGRFEKRPMVATAGRDAGFVLSGCARTWRRLAVPAVLCCAIGSVFGAELVAANPEESTALLEQSFEDQEFFRKLTPFGYTTPPAETFGRWGIFRKNSDAVAVVGESASHGSYSLRVIRRGASSPDAVVSFGPVRKATEVKFSVRTGVGGTFRVTLGEYRDGKNLVAGALEGIGGQLKYQDDALSGALRTGDGQFTPGKWTRFVFRFDPRARKGQWFRDDRGTLRKIGESKLPENVRALQEIRFAVASAEEGDSAWFDDVGIIPIPVLPKRQR